MAEKYEMAGKKITRENFGAILEEMRIKGATELELYGCEFYMEDLYYAFQGGESFITALRIKENLNFNDSTGVTYEDTFINSSNVILENTLSPKTTLDKYDIKFITEIIRENSTITELELSHEENTSIDSSDESLIKDDALTYLLEFLKTNQTIKNLKLVASFFNEQNAILLQELLSSNKVLTDLDLSECNLDAPLLENIRDGLSNNNSLTTLHLCYSNHGIAKIIAEILVQNRLERLSFEDNYFNTEDAKTILAAVKGTKLEYLSMGGANHKIGAGIEETLAEAVRENQRLKYLSISSIKGDTGVFRSIAGNNILKKLDFWVGGSFLNIIARAKQRVVSLEVTEVTADGTKLLRKIDTTDFFGQFARSLAENNVLEELNLSYGEFGDSFLNAITKTNLRVLKLEGTEVTADGLKLLIGKTTSLEELYVSSVELRNYAGNKLEFFKWLAAKIPTLKDVFTAEDLMDDLLTVEEQEELKDHIKRKRENSDQDPFIAKMLHAEEEIKEQISADSEIHSYDGNDQGSSSARTYVGRLELKLQEQGGFVSRFG